MSLIKFLFKILLFAFKAVIFILSLTPEETERDRLDAEEREWQRSLQTDLKYPIIG